MQYVAQPFEVADVLDVHIPHGNARFPKGVHAPERVNATKDDQGKDE